MSTGDPHASGPNPWSRDGAAEQGQPPVWPTYPSAGEPAPPYAAPSDPYAPPAPPAAPAPDPGFDPQPTPPYPGAHYPAAPEPYAPDPYAPESYGQQPNRATPDPYAPTPYQPSFGGYGTYGVVPQSHPQAVLGMVLAIVGLSTSFMCIGGFVGIPALIISRKVKREIDATPGRYSGRGMATAGIVMGIISIVLTALFLVFFAIGVGADSN